MIYFPKGKVIPPSLTSSPMNQRVLGVSAWLDLRGRDDTRFIYTGWATQIDGWQRFVLPRAQTATIADIRCPRACISAAGSVSIQLSISVHRAQLYNAVGVTSLYSHNVCFLFSADTLHNGSVCSTDATQRERCVSDSSSCTVINSSVLLLSKGTATSFKVFTSPSGVYLMKKNPNAYWLGICWSDQMKGATVKYLTGSGSLKSLLISKMIDSGDEME